MGVGVTQSIHVDRSKKTLIGIIYARLSKFIDWIAKGYDGNLPCIG
jgi:hypothetical protein